MMAKVKPGGGKGSATTIMQSRYCLEIANKKCSGLSRGGFPAMTMFNPKRP